jgi:hypothetical protein
MKKIDARVLTKDQIYKRAKKYIALTGMQPEDKNKKRGADLRQFRNNSL